MPEVRSWDAASYHRVSGPMEALGRAVLDRLPLAGDETVLDAGCGSGRVTAALLERLPHGRVVAVDASAAMVGRAREHLAAHGDRVDVRRADLVELDLDEPVDAVLSTATFHWIADHDRLFARLHAALRPGGRLVAQCGGEGNVANVHVAAREAAVADARFAAAFAGWAGPWNFAAPDETEARLARAGFDEARAWLQPAPVTPEDPREYLRTIVLGAHLERLAGALADAGEAFLDAVLERLGPEPTIDYVRLNLEARRPA